jgi:hypothetical protein
MGFTPEFVRDDLRAYLRDSSGLNNLLADGTENSNDDLDRAIRFGLMNFNAVTPFSYYKLQTLPESAYYFVINEAAIQILTSAGFLESRNRLNYSNGGLTVADHDKAAPYQSWIQVLRQFYMQEKQYKIALNIASCFGSVSSELSSYRYESWRIL